MSYVDKLNLNGSEVDLGKPIYYHGLDIVDGTKGNVAQAHILSNSSEAIDSLTKLKAWAEAITGQVFIQCNGCIKVGSVWQQLYLILKTANNEYRLYYVDNASGYTSVNNVNLNDYFNEVIGDAVNKIN